MHKRSISGSRLNPTRLALVDVLRGLAVAQMVVFHCIWDLNYFGWINLAMNRDAPWIQWRAAIVTQFLLLVGVSLVLRTEFKPAGADFWKRWFQVAAAAVLVSLGSAWLLGERFIYFGILHFVAAALILTRPLLRWGRWLIVVGAMAIVVGNVFQHEFFTSPGWNVLGFATHKPRTEDYVPLFPWIGVVWLGVGLGTLWKTRGWRTSELWANLNQHPAPLFPLFPLLRLLRLIGLWPLTIYLLHQPILMAVFGVLKTQI